MAKRRRDRRPTKGEYKYRGGVPPERLAKELLRRVRPYEKSLPKPEKKCLPPFVNFGLRSPNGSRCGSPAI